METVAAFSPLCADGAWIYPGLRFWPGLPGTCWPPAQAAEVLVAGVQQQRGKWGTLCAAPGTAQQSRASGLGEGLGWGSLGAFPGHVFLVQTMKLNWGVNGTSGKCSTKHYWPETCTVLWATALHPRQLMQDLLIAGDPSLYPISTHNHLCPVCSSLPSNSLPSQPWPEPTYSPADRALCANLDLSCFFRGSQRRGMKPELMRLGSWGAAQSQALHRLP